MRTVANYAGGNGGAAGAEQMSVGKVDAYSAWQCAMRAIGPIAADEVMVVVCLDQVVGEGTPMEILRRGLKVLAQHYGVLT